MKTEAKKRKSGFRSGGFYPGTFSDGFGEFRTMKKNEMKPMATGKLLKLNWNRILLHNFLEEKMSIILYKSTILLRSRFR